MCDMYDIIQTKLRRKPWEIIYTQPGREYAVRCRSSRILQFIHNAALLVICVNRITSYLWDIKVPSYPVHLISTMIMIGSVVGLIFRSIVACHRTVCYCHRANGTKHGKF